MKLKVEKQGGEITGVYEQRRVVHKDVGIAMSETELTENIIATREALRKQMLALNAVNQVKAKKEPNVLDKLELNESSIDLGDAEKID